MRALLLSLSLLLGCNAGDARTPETTATQVQAARVHVAEATRGPVSRAIEIGGVAEAWRTARLTPLQPGSVAHVSVQFGDQVRRGQVLARMDLDLIEKQIAQGEASLDLARLQLQNAERERERAQLLSEQGALSHQALDQAQLGYEMAQAQLAQGEASLALLRTQLSKGIMAAPFDGVVTHVGADDGDYFSTMGGLGGPPSVVTVAQLDALRLDLLVAEQDLRRLRIGQEAQVLSDLDPDTIFPGVVERINPAAERGTRSFRVRLKVDNPEALLKPGQYLRARLLLVKHDDVVRVPPEAVLPTADGFKVVLVGSGVSKYQPVTVGLKGAEGWEVSGVDEGAQVAVSGHMGLPNGVTVQAR